MKYDNDFFYAIFFRLFMEAFELKFDDSFYNIKVTISTKISFTGKIFFFLFQMLGFFFFQNTRFLHNTSGRKKKL